MNSESRFAEFYQSELFQRLYVVASRIRQTRFLRARRRAALFACGASSVLALFALLLPAFAAACLYGIFLISTISILYGWIRYRRMPLDFAAAARLIEQDNPQLDQSLITAVQETLAKRPGFLGRRVAQEALLHESVPQWSASGRGLLSRQQGAYLASLALLLGIMGLSYFAAQREVARSGPAFDAILANDLTVSPGDADVERGSALVVTARFAGPLPSKATLVTLSDSGQESRYPMNQSLSDPVFAHALNGISEGLRYRVEVEGASTEDYRVTVYDLPALTQADAALDFPDYTGWRDRTVEDTTRVSAIEGTRLDYSFILNKPVSEAYLQSSDGAIIPLEAANDSATRFRFATTLARSEDFALHLVDDAGRRNPFPSEIRLEALPNERPSLRIALPNGDQRLTPIEEIALVGEASDDFGLLDYGIAFHLGGEKEELRSFSNPSEAARSAQFQTLLALEDYQLEPNDVVSWYLWAEDYDPQGQPRRSTSDLFFADIRPFDEAFREQDGGASQAQAAGGGQDEELIEIQRRISISLFRIKNNETQITRALEDLEVLQNSQMQAVAQLAQLRSRLEKPSDLQAAEAANERMDRTIEELDTAMTVPSLDPLDEAWSQAQSAYQALLQLSPDQFNVARSQNSGGGGGGRSPNQQQLNELEFRQAENRYETASQAQPLASPEELQDLQLLSRLNELSRRQEDLNERLQEMQSALANASTEEEKERIERELKRLEEEQREMLRSADEAIQQAGNRERSRDARRQLEEARETMRRANEQLQQGEVSQSLASGTRAQDRLEQTRESLRNQASSQFSEAMRRAREHAKDLAENQQSLEEEIDSLANERGRSLDDSSDRESIAQALERQSEELNNLLEELQQITEGSEASEPGLYQKLYDILRSQSGAEYDERYDMSAQLLRQGFTHEADDLQDGVAESLEALSQEIASAAETVLGDETTTLRYAEHELEQLQEQLERERALSERRSASTGAPGSAQPGEQGQGAEPSQPSENPSDTAETAENQGSPSSQPGQTARAEGESGQPSGRPASLDGPSGEPTPGSAEANLSEALNEWGRGANAPITGSGFGEWVDRLRIVESLMQNPDARRELAEARETAERARRDFKRHGTVPQWEMLEEGVGAPLSNVKGWVKEELARNEDPDALQPVDRDPVPQEYTEAVRRYYESLGNE